MNRPHQYAIDTAKEITMAALQSSTERTPWLNGDKVAEFFETVYNKVYEIATSRED